MPTQHTLELEPWLEPFAFRIRFRSDHSLMERNRIPDASTHSEGTALSEVGLRSARVRIKGHSMHTSWLHAHSHELMEVQADAHLHARSLTPETEREPETKTNTANRGRPICVHHV